MSRGRMRRRTPRSAVVVALVGAVVALQLGQTRSEPPVADAVVVVVADGDLDLRSSREGMPILSASGLGPGDAAEGQVTVTNAGTGRGDLSLNRHALSDSPGAGGGALSDRLRLVVSDVTVPASPTTVYSGALGSMPEKALGTLGPGQARMYHFEASFPEGGSADNAYAGAAASVGYKWTVSSSSGEPPVDPPPGPTTPLADGPADGGTLPSFVQSQLRLAINLAKKQPVRRKTLAVEVRCTQACSFTARGQLKVKGIRRAFGKTKAVRKTGEPGKWVKLKLKLPPKVLAKVRVALLSKRKVAMKVTVNAKTAKGSKAKLAKSGRIR